MYIHVCVCICYLVAKSCPTLCDPMDCSLPGTSIHRFPKQEYWNGLPFPSPGDLPDPGIKPMSPALVGKFSTTEPPGKPIHVCIYIYVCVCVYICVCVYRYNFMRMVYVCIYTIIYILLGFPGGASGKEPACQCRRCKRHGFDPWVRRIPSSMATHCSILA